MPVCKFHVISFSWFVQYAMMPVVTTKCLVYLNKKKKSARFRPSFRTWCHACRLTGWYCALTHLGFTHCRGPTGLWPLPHPHFPLSTSPLGSVPLRRNVNSVYFQAFEETEPYSISACSDNFVMCNSCSVCNAMHWEYTTNNVWILYRLCTGYDAHTNHLFVCNCMCKLPFILVL